MRNQYSKYKNPDGSTKRKLSEVTGIGQRFYAKLGMQFGNFGRGSNSIKSKKPRQRMIRLSRTMNRSNK